MVCPTPEEAVSPRPMPGDGEISWGGQNPIAPVIRLVTAAERIAVALETIAQSQRHEADSSTVRAAAGTICTQDHVGLTRETPVVAPDATMRLEAQVQEILDRLKRQETLLRPVEKKSFSVEETAELAGYKPWTIREACNKGRIKGRKGDDGRWRIPQAEVVRLQEEGLAAE